MFEAGRRPGGRARRAGAAARRPGVHADQAAGPNASTSATPSSPPIVAAYQRLAAGSATTSRRRASWPREDAAFADGGRRSSPSGRRRWPRSGCATCWCRATPTTTKDAILEVKAGEGGEESALFAGDLLRMYTALRRAARLDDRGARRQPSPTSAATRTSRSPSRPSGTAEPGEAPYALLKFEGGVHRVQRVPGHRESQGRVHTSAAGVLVLPEAEDGRRRDRPERPAHRRVPLVRPRRPERQHHRLRGPDHPPADRHRGVSCQNEKSPAAEPGAGHADPARPAARSRPRRRPTRRRPTRAAARSARSTAPSGSAPTTIPENRISDHRTGYKAYNLDQVLDGDLDAGHRSRLVDADLAARLAARRAQP